MKVYCSEVKKQISGQHNFILLIKTKLIYYKDSLDYMKIALLIVLLALAAAIRWKAEQAFKNAELQSSGGSVEGSLQGGFKARDVKGVDDLDESEKAAYDFLADNVDVAGKKLIYIKSKIVSGIIYCFGFADQDSDALKYCVYSKPWENNYLKLTLDDGTVKTSGGITAEAQTSTGDGQQAN